MTMGMTEPINIDMPIWAINTAVPPPPLANSSGNEKCFIHPNGKHRAKYCFVMKTTTKSDPWEVEEPPIEKPPPVAIISKYVIDTDKGRIDRTTYLIRGHVGKWELADTGNRSRDLWRSIYPRKRLEMVETAVGAVGSHQLNVVGQPTKPVKIMVEQYLKPGLLRALVWSRIPFILSITTMRDLSISLELCDKIVAKIG
ncbi:unnamed protein product [Lepeophtheirus salmonis]|uniref:(salmon louse) hypothetical protein n=1 Tax=Lepeophtheirus salmonis TaxID=72036 RepID=A0A7R8H279_LEPSM|nr:unnamed protein product [Lepeophtheirus salmonis]CAF2819916.1 unnamed protein product [Lepeophtheirus salmonis]